MTQHITHEHPIYQDKLNSLGVEKHNGAHYYSQEIVKYFIPTIKTDRTFVTVNIPRAGCPSHSIVFIHNNKNPWRYSWLKEADDLILVCGVESTCEKVKDYGTPVYLPLSVDVEYVRQFKCVEEERCGFCYAGRSSKLWNTAIPDGVDYATGCTREVLLDTMAHRQGVYAVGRTAIEAKILGCEVLPFDPRYPDPSVWQVLDSRDAARMLQKIIDKADGVRR